MESRRWGSNTVSRPADDAVLKVPTRNGCKHTMEQNLLTLTVLVATIDALGHFETGQCEGMGEVGSAGYEPALLPPCPSIRVLSYNNCQEIHSRQQMGLAV